MRADEVTAQDDHSEIANQLQNDQHAVGERRKGAPHVVKTKEEKDAHHWLPS
jgi:hypothetical protein